MPTIDYTLLLKSAEDRYLLQSVLGGRILEWVGPAHPLALGLTLSASRIRQRKKTFGASPLAL